MNTQPPISVIIPVYNAENYVKDCLDAICRQDLEDIEIICVDDGSTDGSLEILKEYEKSCRGMLVLRQENQGAGAARNLGLEKASGEYVHFLDADDYVADNAYQVMYEKASEYKADVVKTKAYGVDAETGETVRHKWYDLSSVSKHKFNRVVRFEEMPDDFARNVGVVPWNGIYRREFLLENGIRFNSLVCVNDRSFYHHAIVKAQRILLLPERTVYHRTNISTSLVGRRAQFFECHFQSYHIIEEQCRDLTERQKAIVLSAELSDIFAWYCQFRESETYGAEIRAGMKAFLKTLDLDFFVRNKVPMPWKERWIACVNGEMEKINPVKTLLWSAREDGLKATLYKIKKKIGN